MWPTFAAIGLLGALCGCGQPKGIIFEEPATALVWPQPPENPRILYVGQLKTSADLKPAKNVLQAIGTTLFGESSSRSMLTPFSIATDGHDRVFVCDSNAQLIHVFNLASRAYEQWTPVVDGGGFSQPVGVAFDAPNRLLVTDSVAGTIHVFDDNGSYLGEMGADSLVRPTGIAVDPRTRRIYVADTVAHRIVVLAVDGELIQFVGERGIGPGQFNFPTNVAVDIDGNLYVSDTLNFRVQVFDEELRFVRQIGEKGDMPGYFAQPKGIAVDSDGHIYVVDAHFESIQVFDSGGQLLLTFGEEGGMPGQFWLPGGIHIDSRNRIWIADSYNQRIQVFDYRSEIQE